jgi:hypothetical protein
MTTSGSSFEYGDDFVAARLSIDIPTEGSNSMRELTQEVERFRVGVEVAARSQDNFVEMSDNPAPAESNTRFTRTARGQMAHDASCRCSVCDCTFENVESFDRHRFRGRCRTPDMSCAQMSMAQALNAYGPPSRHHATPSRTSSWPRPQTAPGPASGRSTPRRRCRRDDHQ